jgi:hypothetical protein
MIRHEGWIGRIRGGNGDDDGGATMVGSWEILGEFVITKNALGGEETAVVAVL